MREIKFKWYFQHGDTGIITYMQIDNIFGIHQPPSMRHHPIGLCQYTGLKDKNGKEIYEGDVIIGEAMIPCGVIWDVKNGCFRGSAVNMSHVTIPADAFARREIIGNIYENHELAVMDS